MSDPVVACPFCRARLSVAPSLVAAAVRCPRCDGTFTPPPSGVSVQPASSGVRMEPRDGAAATNIVINSGDGAVNGFAVSAMLIGAIAFVFSLVPCLGLLSMPLSFLGLILGVCGLFFTTRGSMPLAVCAAGLNLIAFLLPLAWFVLPALLDRSPPRSTVVRPVVAPPAAPPPAVEPPKDPEEQRLEEERRREERRVEEQRIRLENERLALEKLKLQQEMEARRERDRLEEDRRIEQQKEQARRDEAERARREEAERVRAAAERERRENVSVEHLYSHARTMMNEHVKIKGQVLYKVYPRGNAVVHFIDAQQKTLVSGQLDKDDMTLPRDGEEGLLHLRGRVVSIAGGVVILTRCKVLSFEPHPAP